MGIYAYEDGSIRVVISTANLYAEDWSDYCQGIWVSPNLPLLSADKKETDGAGPTDFKGSLVSYLKHYKLGILEEWIERVKRADFSAVKYVLFKKKYNTNVFFKIFILFKGYFSCVPCRVNTRQKVLIVIYSGSVIYYHGTVQFPNPVRLGFYRGL